jgi:hypothetical protein
MAAAPLSVHRRAGPLVRYITEIVTVTPYFWAKLLMFVRAVNGSEGELCVSDR